MSDVSSGYGQQENVRAILFGLAAALMVLTHQFLLPGIPILFMSLPLIVSYLSLGWRHGLLSSAIAALSVVLFCFSGNLFDILLTTIAPTMIVGHMALKNIVKGKKVWWYPESLIVQDLSVFLLLSVALLSVTCFTEKHIFHRFEDMGKIVNSLEIGGSGEQSLKQHILLSTKCFLKYSVGMAVLTKNLALIFNLRIAHNLLKKTRKNIRPAFDIKNIRISRHLAVLPIVFLAVAYFFKSLSFVFSGLFVVSLFAPAISGISIVYFFAQARRNRSSVIIFYVLLLMLPLQMVFALMIIGCIDAAHPLRPALTQIK